MNKDNDPKHWKLGIFYYNKDNPAESAPKRKGIGTTPNLASKRGRSIFALIFVPAAIVIIICIIVAFLGGKYEIFNKIAWNLGTESYGRW